MVFNWIMAGTLCPVIIVMYFVCRHQGKKTGKLAFGVHAPSDPQAQEKIAAIRERYQRQLLAITLILLVLPLPTFFPVHVSIQFTIWILWFLGALCLLALPFINANGKVMALKNEYMLESEYMPKSEYMLRNESGQEKESASVEASSPERESMQGSQAVHASAPSSADASRSHPSIRYAELTQVRLVRLLPFLVPIAISIACTLPLLFAGDAMEVYFAVSITLAVTTLFFYLIAVWIDCLPVLVISEDSQINVSYARARKNIWKNVWLEEAWLNTATLVLITASALLSFHPLQVLIIALSLEALLALLILFLGMNQQNQVERTYSKSRKEKFEADDDIFWKWGIFYNNPMDKRSLVEKRFGVGMTTNMASPAGKISMVVAVLALAWIPMMCVWLIFEDFTPIQVTVSEGTIICHHLKDDYSIPLEEIDEIALVNELPEWRTKSNGTATDTLEKGRFYASEHGVYYEFLNPENSCFVFLQVDDRIYYLSGVDDDATLALWEEIN